MRVVAAVTTSGGGGDREGGDGTSRVVYTLGTYGVPIGGVGVVAAVCTSGAS